MLKYIHLWLEETVVARWLVNDREVGENFAQANKKGFMVQDQLVSWGNSKQNICHCLVFFSGSVVDTQALFSWKSPWYP